MKPKLLRRLGVAVLAVAVVVGVVVAVNRSQDTPPEVMATFADASGVTLGYTVRAGGVEVGKVSSVAVQNGSARLGLSVDDSVLPLHQDAHATIRPANLLGESYIDLDPGTPTAPVLDPADLDASHTSSAVTLQQVLNTLDDPTATALAAMVTSLGEGVQGAGPQAADAIAALKPAMQQTGELTALLNQQNGALNQLVDRTQPVTNALAAGQGSQLDHLADSTQQTLATVAANRQALDQTLTELPSTVVAARQTLSQLAGTADAATPTLASIRPVTDNLTTITQELHTLADSADPALGALPPVLDKANGLLDQAAPVVGQLRAAGPDLRDTAAGLKPLGGQLLDKNQHLSDLMEFVRKWSLSTNGSDGISHYFRGLVHASPAALQQMLAGSPAGGLLGQVAPQTGQALPQIPGTGQGPAAGQTPAAGQAPPTQPGNATGLTSQQESSMVGQLLGGH
ncbi:flagellar export chaperone FlgN [Actinomycetospora endophytica]|uniref:Flagellar export chaperone FlgN n=1 Tax=Actinomycetospora endophytica TaxID=2291215 RepID=A0ABS8PL88_9PSEU|nr:flagellar export chaperone FlgN [Actinomycetospora endophytica]MCD2198245.1 flagellar export chaperone FlgN [Actinomycetospora endophytica]